MPLYAYLAALTVLTLLLGTLGYAIRDTSRSRRRLDTVYRVYGYHGDLAQLRLTAERSGQGGPDHRNPVTGAPSGWLQQITASSAAQLAEPPAPSALPPSRRPAA